jgi:hypothetical protein
VHDARYPTFPLARRASEETVLLAGVSGSFNRLRYKFDAPGGRERSGRF